MAIDNGNGHDWRRPDVDYGTPTVGALFVAFIVILVIIVGLFALVKYFG